MIRFDSVTKRYRGAPRAALDDISLEIGSGEFVFLVGASGSGKSSLLRLVLREEKPSSGEVHVLGQRLTSISSRKVPYFRRSLGVVFQDFRLLPNKTVFDNVAFTLQVIGKSRAFIHAAVPDVLSMVGLAEKAQNLPTELSGGEQQRVAIARAVVNKPAILLADEPTGNLDPTTSQEIMQVLDRVNAAGTTVVMATHDVSIVDRMQKRVVELVNGRIIRDELEASYVTSSIPLPRKKPEPEPESPPEVPVWARRGSARTAATGEAPAPAGPQPAAETGPQAAAPGGSAPATGENRAPIWARSDSGPVLLPGGDPSLAHAPWRAAPVAPPAPPADTDATALFFAPPLPAPRPAWNAGGDEDGDEQTSTAPTADPGPPVERPEARPAAIPPWRAPAPPEPRREPTPEERADARREVRTITGPIDLDNTGDPDGAARQTGKHRIVLPDHLDFVGGLGLRPPAATDEDDEVGPSS